MPIRRVGLLGVLCWACLAPNAKADMCFGGGDDDDRPPGAAGAAGEAGAAGAVSALHGVPTRRYAGGSLLFVGALGSIWLVARRKSGSRRPE